MAKLTLALAMFIGALTLSLVSCGRSAAPSSPAQTPYLKQVLGPSVAGRFYPHSPEELVETVDALLADAERLAGGPPTVLIVPHAGYTYSGLVAAWAYKQLEGTSYEAIVLIAPSHHARREETISVYARGALQTPLGLVPVDEELASALIAADQRIVSDPAIFAGEHSVEVQLPFLQRMVEKPAIVPVIMSDPSLQNCSSLSQALAKVLAGKSTLIIATSDLSHYPHYEDAIRVDGATLTAIQSLDIQELKRTIGEHMAQDIPGLACVLCGEGPVLVAMLAARELGAEEVILLKYANSGDVPAGDKSSVVGYGAVMFRRRER